MNQFWTPLAKVFGLGPTPSEERPAQSHASSWPALIEWFRQYALEQWVPAHKRHGEISPHDVLSVRRLAVQATRADVQTMLDDWKGHGTPEQLIDWLRQGPWNTPEIRHAVHLSDLEELVFLPCAETVNPSSPLSPYDHRASPASQAPLLFIAETAWIARPPPPALPEPAPEQHTVWVQLEDAHGQRRFTLQGSLFVLGQSKPLSWHDGQVRHLRDGDTLQWQGKPAVFVAVEGRHVSGMHLALRLHADGYDVQDLGSSNGTYAQNQALEPLTWHRLGPRQWLCLGGPHQDAPQDAPRLSLLPEWELPAHPTEPTPLRAAAPPPPPAAPSPKVARALVLRLEGSNGWSHAWPLGRFPFRVGRDMDCDGVVPAEFSKVSRHHFVVESWDEAGQRVRIRDTSTHGLQVQSGHISGDPRQGAWLALNSEFIIGASSQTPFLRIAIVQRNDPEHPPSHAMN